MQRATQHRSHCDESTPCRTAAITPNTLDYHVARARLLAGLATDCTADMDFQARKSFYTQMRSFRIV